MFEHSVRVPRHYKVAANIFKKVSTEGGSVKTLLYDNKLRHFRTNVLFALITETVKHAVDIDKIFESSEILKKESRLDPWLAKVLTAELLFGKKALPGISKPEQTVLAYKEQFEKYLNEHEDELKTEVVHRPRYVRINTNLLTTSDAIRSFQDEGYRFIRCTSGSYDDYIQQIKGLTEYDFTQDYHVKTIFVFPHGTKLHEHDLYLESQIILQDKATAMAVHLLAPPPGSVVLDMCAAPGMKTTQVAAFMRNEGKVYAVERNERRYQTLTDFVNKTGCKCVEPIHKDVFEIRKGDYDDVEYILLDPSCSGSGMEFSVHNYVEDTRLAKLTSLQEKFLKHAMNAFPKTKRIVYSTCSLFPEENERVITNVVKNSRVKWRVQDVKEMLKGHWNNFGSGMYGSMGTRCLYAKPDSDLTTGFFLAVLDRDTRDLEKTGNVDEIEPPNKIITKKEKCKDNENFATQMEDQVHVKKNNRLEQNTDINTFASENILDDSFSGKKRKKSRAAEQELNITALKSATNVMMETEQDEKISKKKAKKRKEHNDKVSNCNYDIIINQEDEVPTIKKKKKKFKTIDYILPNNAEVNEGNPIQKGSDKAKKKSKNLNISDFDIGNDAKVSNEISETCYKNVEVEIKQNSYNDDDTQMNSEDKATPDNEFVKVKKKKKKHSIKDNIENQSTSAGLLEGQDERVRSKKKKYKYSDVNSELSPEINKTNNKTNVKFAIRNDNESVAKKKKKKHDKTNLNSKC